MLPANDLAVTVLNQLITAILPPRMVPKLDLHRGGVPPEQRTAVVIPTLFEDSAAVRRSLETLEVRYLANREAHLHFALLSDFTDSPSETTPEDALIVATAREGIRALNQRYAPETEDAFYLFHRPRRWNPTEGVWMGWERKRGKLAEFNRFVRGAAEGAFSVIVGNVEPIHRLRYVITLDADTVLPPDSAPDLIGAIAHPLNRAEYDAASGRVIHGYGILQPRVGVSLPSAYRSVFSAIYSDSPGVDPYTTAVSDVYQDLYGEGSFTGKGIYDIDAFERATGGRFPENRLLSHDLIEGNYARTGLVTDVNIYDDYPSSYLTYTRRKHRWIRGDWQLLQWLGPEVPGPEGAEPNRLSVLSRWKILDNLRRSTVEIAQLVLLVAGWTILPGSPLRWTLLGLGAIAAGRSVAILLTMIKVPRDRSWRAYFGALGLDAIRSLQQLGLAIVFLPHQAWVSADAIVRTVWRLFGSRRHLLEWETASAAERTAADTRGAIWRAMAPAMVLVAVIATVVLSRLLAVPSPSWRLGIATLPILFAWAIAPLVAYALGAPAIRPERRLPASGRRAALRYALLHWRFFERFVGPDTHWLAPDNVQDDPVPVTAMRTSPTNIGLQLLATVSAYDLGFLPLEELVVRLERTFSTLERMPRFRGHFYNWYDVGNLSVLEPAYVSTVDSGNLAGHLIALRQACLTLADHAPTPGVVARAIETALGLARASLDASTATRKRLGGPSKKAVEEAEHQIERTLDALRSIRRGAAGSPRLSDLSGPLGRALHLIAGAELPGTTIAREWITWCLTRITGDDETATAATGQLAARLDTIAELAYRFALAMEFGFLFDRERKLFSIGYQQTTHSLDASSYDLLASEARLASFVAIAKNDVPVEHWFRLGRQLTYAAGGPAMVSWSGSMFEYLMPALVMESLRFTLLDQTYRGAVRRQMAYGAERGVPWGMSESAYNVRDRSLTYQYRAFGVPDLALKRGLGRELVVAPYASALATEVEPEAALRNLAALERLQSLGEFGFYDAIDYTRPNPESDHAVVHNYMAHHVGMSLVALTNAVTGNLWQRRFHVDPLVRSAELLLHERIPRQLVLREAAPSAAADARTEISFDGPAVREIETIDTPQPRVALLGRPPFTLMVTHCGGGYSRYEGLAVTRWRSDGTTDDTGEFCYLKDVSSGAVWSAAHQPTGGAADWYRATLATDRVTFHRTDGELETRTEIAVVPDDAAEVRRVTVTNNGSRVREVELTSYGEIVLASPESDRAHPAFGNLFVETEWHEWCSAITAVRRPREADDPALICVHVVDTGKERIGAVSCETDRARFLGRGRSVRDPVALTKTGPLSGTTGAVLDPIFALRTRLRIEPGQSASAAFTTLVATNRERAFELAGRYHDPHAAQRALDLAWTSTQLELRELGLTPADATVFQELAGALFFGNPAARAPETEQLQNRGSQPRLWGQGISGDWPITLATISSLEGIPTLRQVLAAHRYWRRRGMTVDLVIMNAHPTTYQADLEAAITSAIQAFHEGPTAERPGGVFVRRRDLVPPPELLMIRTTARLLVPCDGRPLGRIAQSLKPPRDLEADLENAFIGRPRRAERSTAPVRGLPWRLLSEFLAPEHRDPEVTPSSSDPVADRPPLAFDNGFGGVTPEGDYEIRLAGDRLPPAPWVNVIANRAGGFIVSERGAGYSWADNSHFFRLTPWRNDPVVDPPTEVLYLRDEATGDGWCPTPAPAPTPLPYTIRHGAGASTFHHERRGIQSELRLGMVPEGAVKCALLRLTNRGDTSRRLTLTSYVEWSLGALREHTQHHVVTSYDGESRTMFARNTFDPQYAGWVAFHALSEPITGHTADRREWVGRNGTLGAPAGLDYPVGDEPRLSGASGAGLDPCAVLQCTLELAPGETRVVASVLGAAADLPEARRAVAAFRDPARAAAALDAATAAWNARLSQIVVRTPEPTFDILQNRWLLYQALACRMWARSGLYQSSGAYGFRDQLQDTMAFVYAEPALAREHIVRSAGRQFEEGDVQHWWHPSTGRGIRTRMSDDLVWLPYVVDHYLKVTGDRTILDESVPFLRMRPLEPGEQERYDLPEASPERATIHEHCLRALRRATTTGVHGLPLIGGGDWNDGMNRVGIGGKGESVWLAWFLIAAARGYADQTEARGELGEALELRAGADRYTEAVEAHGWDGDWYRRAFYDDGTALGSRDNDECRIDSLAQSWSVISAAGDPERRSRAMRAVGEHLVDGSIGLIRLLEPPFDRTKHDPGYIKGYLPGVRENGAQYTHAALWVVLATALEHDGDRALSLYQMLNPLSHTATREGVAVYQVEPYVVAADVYTAAGRIGRGGWTWYTGSASWMYRVGLESILGLKKRGDELWFEPAVPAHWPEFSMAYRYGQTNYDIVVRTPGGITAGRSAIVLDGRPVTGPTLRLVDDGRPHRVTFTPPAEEPAPVAIDP
jgi:cellobiose phosphorylase